MVVAISAAVGVSAEVAVVVSITAAAVVVFISPVVCVPDAVGDSTTVLNSAFGSVLAPAAVAVAVFTGLMTDVVVVLVFLLFLVFHSCCWFHNCSCICCC